MSGEIETKAQDTEEGQITQRWLREIELASAHEKKWRERAEKVIKRYRDEEAAEQNETRQPRFNILYANTEVLRGVIYQRQPVPDVRRRFLAKDQVGRESAQVLQRALSICADSYDFDGMMSDVVEDYLLPGRGLAKVRYVPEYGPLLDAAGQPVMDEAGKPMQQVVYESVEAEYVEWEMVRFSPAKRWGKVRWIAFGELLTRDELVQQFGEKIGEQCTLDWAPKDKEQADEMFKRALVWSIWDKTSRKVHVVSKGMPAQRLAVVDDPLKLEGFFPCPKPVYSIRTTNTMVPIPEYTEYQDQACEVDNLTARIDALTDALRRRGLYNASYPEIEKLASAGDNEFIPVEKYSELIEKGIPSALWEAPIDAIAKVITGLVDLREKSKQIIYEVTGIADVVRGVSQASETLGAQQLKARYANSRIEPRQKAIANFARDLMRIKAEIIAEKFSAQTLAQMTGFDLAKDDAEKQVIAQQMQAAQAMGQQIEPPEKLKKPTWEQIVKLLRDDKLRGFRVDVETDSTVQPDANEEQKNRVELLSAITQFAQGVAPAVQSGALPMSLAKELLSFGVRGFKVSPQIEDALDQIGADDGGNNAAQERMKAAQTQIQTMMTDAQAQIEEQKKAAEQIIAQAKDAKYTAGMEAQKTAYEKKLSDALEAIARKEAELSAREIEIETERQIKEAVTTLQTMVDGFRSELAASACQHGSEGEAEPQHDPAQKMEEMHRATVEAFGQMVAMLTAPRKRTAIRGDDGRMAGFVEEMA
jgi:hypothetical protein